MPDRESDAVDPPPGAEPQLALLVQGGDRKGLLHDMTAAVMAVAATARFDIERVRGRRF